METLKGLSPVFLRQQALERFQRIGFPGIKAEEYRHTPITRRISSHFNEQEQIANTASDYHTIDAFLLSDVSKNKLVFINGKFCKALSSWENLPEQVIISTLHEAATTHPELITSHFAQCTEQKDPFALFNTAQWHDGLFIYVPVNTSVDEPIAIHHIHDAQHDKIASHTRLLAIVEANSKLNLIEKVDSVGTKPVFTTFNEEIVVQENASLEYCKIQDDSGSLYKVTNTHIHQFSNSQVSTCTFTLAGEMIRNNLHIRVNGQACTSKLYGLYLTRGKTLVDNHTAVDHVEPGSMSDERYKGIINEKSQGVFNGKIYVRPQAQQTNAFQSNQNILLSEVATLHAKPQLEIWADDVKCSHGCTSGQLDSAALFYLQSRGIPKPTAQAILLHAFANEITEPITNDTLKSIIHHRISDQLLHHGFGV